MKVVLDRKTHEIQCSCRLFEYRGIICRHCIRVMEMTNMPTVPDRYVLQRWRKDIKRKHLSVKVAFNDPDKTEEEQRYGRLQYEFEGPFQIASLSDDMCEYAIEVAHKLAKDLDEMRLCNQSHNTTSEVPSDYPSTQGSNEVPLVLASFPGDDVANPPQGKRIGRPPKKTPYGLAPKKKKGASNSKGSTEGSITTPLFQVRRGIHRQHHRS